MTEEGHNIDRKSLKMFTGSNPQWKELAKDCVCFANAQGGTILIGFEDRTQEPPEGKVKEQYLSGPHFGANNGNGLVNSIAQKRSNPVGLFNRTDQ